MSVTLAYLADYLNAELHGPADRQSLAERIERQYFPERRPPTIRIRDRDARATRTGLTRQP